MLKKIMISILTLMISNVGFSVSKKEGPKPGSKFESGQKVIYYKGDQTFPATIIAVHLDEEQPFYTIMVEGREKQTVEERLKTLAEHNAEDNDVISDDFPYAAANDAPSVSESELDALLHSNSILVDNLDFSPKYETPSVSESELDALLDDNSISSDSTEDSNCSDEYDQLVSELDVIFEDIPLLDSTPRINFIALVDHKKSKGNTISLNMKHAVCSDFIDCDRFKHFLNYKLKNVPRYDFSHYYSSQLGNWFIKRVKGKNYVIATSKNYPRRVAIEAVEELYQLTRNPSIFPRSSQKSAEVKQEGSRKIMEYYGTREEEIPGKNLAHRVDKDIEDSGQLSGVFGCWKYLFFGHKGTKPVMKKDEVKELRQEVEIMKKTLQDNIIKALEETGDLQELNKLSSQTLKKSKVFKKKNH